MVKSEIKEIFSGGRGDRGDCCDRGRKAHDRDRVHARVHVHARDHGCDHDCIHDRDVRDCSGHGARGCDEYRGQRRAGVASGLPWAAREQPRARRSGLAKRDQAVPSSWWATASLVANASSVATSSVATWRANASWATASSLATTSA